MKKTFWLLPLFIAIPLLAVTPQFWETRSYDEFRRGKLTDLSLTSDSELILAPRLNSVFNTEQTLIWSAVSDSNGNIYLGTGHEGKIFKVDSSGPGTMIERLGELDVSALALDGKGVLYAATSPDGKVYRIEGPATASPQMKEFYRPDAKYIWALAFDKQGQLLVATGDKGIIYRVAADGKGEPFYTTDETHVVSLAVDKQGNVIAGGDPKGYIYRISPDGKKAFVLYDSGMREVHSLALAGNGNIYAAVLSGRPAFLNAAPTPPTTSSTGGEPTVSVTVHAAEVAGQAIEVVDTPDQSPAVSTKTSSKRNAADSNAQSVILEVQADGTVNTLWRSNDEMVFSLLLHDNSLLFSTGTKGRIYSLSPANPREVSLLVESTEEQTTKLIESGKRVYAATANIGKLFSMDSAPASSGTYESIVRDTEAISTWGRIAWKGLNPDLVQISTRSGNTSSPDKTWSEWTAVDANNTPTSPKARFIQWKATLKSDKDRLPRLTSVTVPYLQQNFRPEVTSIDVLPPGVALIKTQTFNANGTPTGGNDAAAARASARAGQPVTPRVPPRKVVQKGAQSFQWTATDRNDDYLTYDVYYRGDAEKTWRLLKKDIEDNFYTINSDTLPDGTYQVRIVASDQPSNPPDLALTGEAESRTFTIDNTPPTVTMKLDGVDQGRARIAIDAVDTTSTLNQAEISVDTGEWRPVFPKNGIIDSKSESFSYLSSQLTPGEHVIAFRVYDQNDNVGMQKLIVRIP
jgi:hypothetical protein